MQRRRVRRRSAVTKCLSAPISGRGWTRTAAVGAAAALAVTLAPAPAIGSPATPGAQPAPQVAPVSAGVEPRLAPGSYQVTLITGDEVVVEQHPDGRLAIDVDARVGDPDAFEMIDSGEDVYVLPAAAAALVPERLDMELFNVTGLVRAGFHAEGTGDLPVIITYQPGASTATPATVAGATELPSIDGAAASLDQSGAAAVWRQLTRADRTLAAGGAIDKIWLDQRLEVALDESVPLVDAPGAWDAGFDGSGITVAVLDTGIDAEHPDLAGQVVDALSFIPGQGVEDEHGHGTHVAATVAGTGAGADGLRPGTAPGASLVNAKVCNQSGSCPTSSIIGGMEWVAGDLGVDVANLSIGTATASDGTDPLSQAVNQLTAEHGTLFVIAAGNAGPGATTVGSPGAADAALTVGSVSKAEALAFSSSRGPRRGDFAIKPDVTAPGVNIVAARAAGTSMGTPVDDLYTQASGTSMAAPHVAGAAAILLQQDSGLTPAQVKAALATTGAPHSALAVYQQGGGRLDVRAAVEAPVLATPAPLDLGYFPFPHDHSEPATRDLTYTNRTGEELTLHLSLAVTDENGNPPAAGMLTLSADTVTVPAGGTATIEVTVDPEAGDFGLYGGYLIAEQEGAPVTRTPLGFFKEDERYEIAVQAIDSEGNPATGGLTIINVEDQSIFFELTVNYDAAGQAFRRVPPGTYAVFGFADTHPEGETFATVRTAVAEPEFEVTGDVELVFDAREATPFQIDAPAHDVAAQGRVQVGLTRQPEVGAGASRSVNAFADADFQAVASSPASRGMFELNSSWRLHGEDEAGTPVLYHLVLPETGAIPDTLDYLVHPEELGISHQEFYHHPPQHPIQELRHWWRPWMTSSLAVSEPVAAPALRTEFLAPAEAVSWTRNLLFAPAGVPSTAGRMNMPRMEYQPGEEETRTWMKQPVVPGLIEGSPWHPTFPQFREGDTLDLFIPEFSDSQRAHWGLFSASTDEAAFRLFVDGELIAEAVRANGEFELPPERSRIRVETDISRDQDWWHYSTHTATAWEFESEHTAEFLAQIVAPEQIDLALNTLTNSPDLDGDLEAPLVYAGLGQVEDFAEVDADGAVVLMQRGVLSFGEKATNAANAGAAAAIIFNNQPGNFTGTLGDHQLIPAYAMSLEQGEEMLDLLDAGEVTVELVAGEPDLVPLLLVDYEVELDLLNRAVHPRDLQGPRTVALEVYHQPGFDGLPVPGRPAIDGARLWISHDDGATWQERPGGARGDGQFEFILDNRDPVGTNGFVALRVEAWDADGNRVEQEITRAWGSVPR